VEPLDVLDPDFGPVMKPSAGIGHAAEVHHGVGEVAEGDKVTGGGVGGLAGEDAEAEGGVEFGFENGDGRIPVRNPGLIRHLFFVGVLGDFCNEKGGGACLERLCRKLCRARLSDVKNRSSGWTPDKVNDKVLDKVKKTQNLA
jgi:hypothetical protein